MRTRNLGLTPLLILLAIGGGVWAFIKLGEVGTTSPVPTPTVTPSASPTLSPSPSVSVSPTATPTAGDMGTAIAAAIAGTPAASHTDTTVTAPTPLPTQDVQPSPLNATIVCPGYKQQPFEARFRVQPGLGTQVYGQLRCGTPIFFTGQTTTASGIQWRQVTYQQRTGWVALNYVSPWR